MPGRFPRGRPQQALVLFRRSEGLAAVSGPRISATAAAAAGPPNLQITARRRCGSGSRRVQRSGAAKTLERQELREACALLRRRKCAEHQAHLQP